MKRIHKILILMAALLLLTPAAILYYRDHASYGFAHQVEQREAELRLQVVATAERWLDTRELDENHGIILDIYNSHEPLAQDYRVKLEDNWCAAFASSVAISCELTDIIPTECGCQRQIGLWADIGRWEENDNYLPLPGDYIYYAWDEDFSLGDCTGWADHVGIVVGTAGPFIKVIEGNKDDSVAYRTILQGNWQIRGYGIPDYAGK